MPPGFFVLLSFRAAALAERKKGAVSSVYALLSEFPGAQQIAAAHLTHLKSVLSDASKGHYGREKAIQIRDAARNSIGCQMPAKSLELKHTIALIRELDAEIAEGEAAIQEIMDEIQSPITTIPGIGTRMAAMILAEVGDFSMFSSPDKILAYAGLSPSTYQSGQLTNCYSHMEKRGSRYLRYAIFNATKFVCNWYPTFATYLAKKRAEGKHYNVAISHAAKKLVRLIYAMEKSRQPYRPAATLQPLQLLHRAPQATLFLPCHFVSATFLHHLKIEA